MVKKADTVAKRWAEAVNSGIGADLSAGLQKLTKKFGPDALAVIPDWNEDLPKWVDPTIAIFRLNPSSPFDQAARTAFDKAGLDPKHPVHWKLLVGMFAWAHFGERGRRGRRRDWTDERYVRLFNHFFEIRKEKPTISCIQVCRLLKKRHPAQYGEPGGKPSAERLDKEAKKAFDPNFNPMLAHFSILMLEIEKVVHLKKGLEWGPDIEAETIKTIHKIVKEQRNPKKDVPASVSN
jgi:hypothetical protein